MTLPLLILERHNVTEETPRERFLRNHEDCVNRMKAARVSQIRLGNHEKAREMQAIIDMWTGIASDVKSVDEENSGEEWKQRGSE